MKKGLKFLSVLTAAALSMGFCLSACSQETVHEHDHIWDEGKITVQPTCHSEGVKIYSCTVEGCGVIIEEPISMTEHNWDNGTVTTEHKCNAAGVITYKCTNEGCDATKPAYTEKSDHHWEEESVTSPADFFTKGEKQLKCKDCGETKAEVIPAQADFVSDFYEDIDKVETSPWKCAYMTQFDSVDYDSEQPKMFGEADIKDGVWGKEGVEIGKGNISVDAGKTAVVAYIFQDGDLQQLQASMEISFKTTTANGPEVWLYDGTDADLKAVNKDNTAYIKDFYYAPETPIDIPESGTQIILYLDNNASEKVSGELSFTLKAPCLHIWEEDGTVIKPSTTRTQGEETFKCVNEGCGKVKTEKTPVRTVENLVTDFDADFADTLAGNSDWKVGKVVYNFEGGESFTFESINGKNADNSGFKNEGEGEPFMEIKGDFAAIGGWAGLEYTFASSYKGHIDFTLLGINGSNFNVRYAVRHGEATAPEWGGGGNSVAVSKDIEVAAGDKLYILIEKDGGSAGNQCYYSIILTGEEFTPEPVLPEITNFATDFADTLAGNSNWKVGKVVYNFEGGESFTFEAINGKNADNSGFKNEGEDEPFMEIKGDWAAVGSWAGFEYTFDKAYKANLDFTFTPSGSNVFHLRWVITDSEGHFKDGNPQYKKADGAAVTIAGDITVAAGDKLYILIEKDGGSAGDQCTYSIVITGEEVKPAEPFTGANFAEDFADTLDGKSNWQVGKVKYSYGDKESFNFVPYGAGDVKEDVNGKYYHIDDPWTDFKGDWAAIVRNDAYDMVGVEFTFGSAAQAHLNFIFTPSGSNVFHIRWAITDSQGKMYSDKAVYNKADGAAVTIDGDINAKAGDKLYIFIEKDGASAGDQCTYTIELTDKSSQPTTPFAGANFAEDFHGGDVTNSNWLYGYTTDYDYDNHTFTFNQLTEYTSEGWKNDENGILLRSDYFQTGTGSLVVGYKVPDGQSKLKVTVEYSASEEANPRYSARIVVVHKDGTRNFVDYLGGKDSARDWKADREVDVADGDIIYVALSHESGWEQGKLQILVQESQS